MHWVGVCYRNVSAESFFINEGIIRYISYKWIEGWIYRFFKDYWEFWRPKLYWWGFFTLITSIICHKTNTLIIFLESKKIMLNDFSLATSDRKDINLEDVDVSPSKKRLMLTKIGNASKSQYFGNNKYPELYFYNLYF